VLADLFDMHINTAVRWVHRAKRDWSSYIATRAEDLNHKHVISTWSALFVSAHRSSTLVEEVINYRMTSAR